MVNLRTNLIGRAFSLVLAFALMGCCYHRQKVILEEPNFKAEKRVLVYEDSGGTAGKLLRGALRQKDIKVLKYASRDIVESKKTISNTQNSKNESKQVEVYRQYNGTPYVVEIEGKKRSDVTCLMPWDDGCVWDLDVEIADLTTREAVYSFSLSGFDDRCGYCSGGVFDEAADLIASFWEKQGK